MLAVLGLMVESSAVGEGIFIPLVAVLCDVALHFAPLAVELLQLLILIFLTIIICF